MSNVNFRKTRKGYSAQYQRQDGFGFETRYFKGEEITELAQKHGWKSPDEQVPGENWTVAEMLIVGQALRPYRIATSR